MPDKQNFNSVIDTERLTVRRLTPLECERLQGFPDGWTDIGAWVGENGKSHAESADTARYKALGNKHCPPTLGVCLDPSEPLCRLRTSHNGKPL